MDPVSHILGTQRAHHRLPLQPGRGAELQSPRCVDSKSTGRTLGSLAPTTGLAATERPRAASHPGNQHAKPFHSLSLSWLTAELPPRVFSSHHRPSLPTPAAPGWPRSQKIPLGGKSQDEGRGVLFINCFPCSHAGYL